VGQLVNPSVVGRAMPASSSLDLGDPTGSSRGQELAMRGFAGQSSVLLSASGDEGSFAAGRISDDNDATASADSAALLAAGALASAQVRASAASVSFRSVAVAKAPQLSQPTHPHGPTEGHGLNPALGQVSPDTLESLQSPAYLRRSEPFGREHSLRGGSGTSELLGAEADQQQNHMGHPRAPSFSGGKQGEMPADLAGGAFRPPPTRKFHLGCRWQPTFRDTGCIRP
jgi:hypothetical protein